MRRAARLRVKWVDKKGGGGRECPSRRSSEIKESEIEQLWMEFEGDQYLHPMELI